MPTLSSAFQFLELNAKDLFGNIQSMLYVGHRGDTHPWWRTDFCSALGNPKIAVLDIDKGNLGTAAEHTSELIHADILTHETIGYGLVFWDEGPEHVSKVDALDCLKRLASTNYHVLISCPWGYQPQGSGPSDKEYHHWGPMPEDFESIGFKTMVFGTMFNGQGAGHGNLIAWI